MTADAALDVVFRAETEVLVDEVETRLVGVERAGQALEQEWRALLGALHTIKGNCGMVERDDAEAACHALEERARVARAMSPAGQVAATEELLAELDAMRRMAFGADAVRTEITRTATTDARAADNPRAVDGVRVSPEQLDRLLELGDDVAALLDRVTAIGRGARRRAVPLELGELGVEAARSVEALRRAVMALRLVPLRALLGRFDRPVRDLARQTGKLVEMRVRVGDLAVDKQVADRLHEPLLHILRNGVDHGLELPRERARAGKPEIGAIEIAAEVEAGRLVLTIRDDGRGLDPIALRAAAAARGRDVAGLDDAAALELVFAPEVSTARTTTTRSGRGVGLDQARRGLEAIGGAIEVASTRGAGTELRLRVPLALALQRALVVRRGDVLYAVPFRATIEVVRLAAAVTRDADVLGWRGSDVPVVAPPDGTAAVAGPLAGVVVARRDHAAALIVDDVLGYQDVTIRELDPLFGRPRGVAGAALLGDGRIAFVIDADALAEHRPREAA